MRVMIVSVAPWCSSGYGTQTAKLALSLKKDGHDVAIAATFGLEGGMINWNEIPVFPRARDGLSAALLAHIDFWGPDFVISLTDLWGSGSEIYGYPNFKWVPWLPVDHEPLSPFYRERLRTAWHVVSMSEHGKKTLEEAGVRSTYIPHGVESDFFQDNAARKAWREAYGISKSTFVFGIVAMNAYWPSRKGFSRLLEAYKDVHEKYHDTLLYMHTTKQALNANYDLTLEMQVHGIPEDAVKFTDEYPLFLGYDLANMRAMYNGFDCFVLPTQGEGFGIPVIEAQSCGVPVIATDCTSMPQLTQEDMRILVPAEKFMTLAYGYQFDVNKDALAEAMCKAYEQLKDECPCHAGNCDGWPWRRIVSMFAKNYAWDHVYAEYWRPFIAKLQSELKSPAIGEHISVGDTGCETYYLEDYNGEKAVKKVNMGGYHGDLIREAGILSTFDHPNLPALLEYGTDEFDRAFMITEFCGFPLTDDIIKEHGYKIWQDVKSAVEYVNSKGIVHRDVKLDNIVWDGEKATLVDFGWAKESDDFRPDWDASGDITPGVAQGIVYDTGLDYLKSVLMPTSLLERIENSTATGLPIPYQDMGLDVPVERDCQQRWDVMQPNVAGKRILDLGCNLGWFVKKSLECGALAAIGLDRDKAIIEAATQLVNGGGFLIADLDDADPTDGFSGEFDIMLALSVIMHMKKPERLWDLVNKHNIKEIYLEVPRIGEYDEKRDTADWFNLLQTRGFNVELKGYSDRSRPIFYLTRRING